MTKNEAREAAFKQYRKEWFDVGVSVPSLGVDFKNGFDAGWDVQQAEIERVRGVSRALENIGTLVCNCGNLADAVATMIEAALGGEVLNDQGN